MAQIKNSNGAVIGSCPLSRVAVFLADAGLKIADVEVIPTKAEVRVAVRDKIANDVGDDKTLIGELADVVSLLLGYMLADLATLPEPETEAHIERLAILEGISGGVDVVQVAREALDKISTGEAVLTASAKGVQAVIDDTLQASTKVSGILSGA